jgi:WD40 repeat protein
MIKLSERKEGLKAISGFITTLAALIQVLRELYKLLIAADVPATLSLTQYAQLALWLLLLVFGLWMLWPLLTGRSRLLRPETLRLDPYNRQHLKGREDDIDRLSGLCREFPQVHMVGESGAGKSALVLAGLCPELTAHNELLPLYLDTWGEDWEAGPRTALAGILWKSLSEDDRQALELMAPPQPEEILHNLLGQLHSALARMPLLIFDQFDDYQARHRRQFMQDSTWLVDEELVKANPFWSDVEAQLKDGNLHCLFVTRSDAADGLESVRFVAPKVYHLDRLPSGFVEPLLTELTTPGDEAHPIIQSPGRGWDRLKQRLVRDLTQEGTVLPSQMRMAFQGLATLKALTIRDYERVGSLRGLEARFVESRVASAARHSGLARHQILSLLTYLVERNKTIPRSTTELAQAIGVTARSREDSGDARIRIALDYLEQRGLIRTRIDPDSSQNEWLLYHDYLSRAVLEADRRANHWFRLAQDTYHAFQEAGRNLWRRWRSLLNPWQQLMLVIQWIRGRFRYGPLRSYALLSLFRFAPYVGVIIVGVMANQALQNQLQEEKEARIGTKLEQRTVRIWQHFDLAELDNLLKLIQIGRTLQDFVKDGRPIDNYPAISPILTLQMSLHKIHQRNQLNPSENILSVSYSLKYDHDQFLATGGDEGTIRVWRVSGQQISSWNSSHGQVLGVSFSPTQQRLATVGSDGKLRFWNLSGKRKPLWVKDAHQYAATSVSFSPDGQQIATGGQDGMVRLWSLSGEKQDEWQAYKEGGIVHWSNVPNGVSVSFSPDGEQLATAGPSHNANRRAYRENKIRLWDLSGNPQGKINVTGEVFGLNFGPNGQRLITAQQGEAVILDLAGRELSQYVSTLHGWVWDVTFSPDGQRFIAAGLDGRVRIWELSKQLDQKELSWQAYERGRVLWPQYPFSADGKYLSILSGGKFRLWNVSVPGEFLTEFNKIESFAFDPKAQRFVLGTKNGTIELWNLLGTQKFADWLAHQGKVVSVNFNSNGQCLFTWGNDKILRLWSVSGNKEPQKLKEWSLVFTPRHTAVSRDDQYIAAVGTDGILRLWPLFKNKLIEKKLKEWRTHIGPTRSIVFSPDGELLATAGDDKLGPVRLWDLSGKKQADIIPIGEGRIEQVNFSPDGQLLATAGIDATARLWTLSGQQVAQFEVYPPDSGPWIRSVSFNPDGQLLATGDEPYSKVTLWRVKKSDGLLDYLLEKGCEWLQEYLDSHPDAPEVCPNQQNI